MTVIGFPEKHVHPKQELIERLEDLLERARSGEVVGVAYVAVTDASAIDTGWVWYQASSHSLTAGINYLQHRFLTVLHAECDDCSHG